MGASLLARTVALEVFGMLGVFGVVVGREELPLELELELEWEGVSGVGLGCDSAQPPERGAKLRSAKDLNPARKKLGPFGGRARGPEVRGRESRVGRGQHHRWDQ